MKSPLKVIAIVFGVLFLVGAGSVLFASRGLEEGMNVVIVDVGPAGLTDGLYEGEYAAGRWTNRVEIVVQDGRIAEILLKKGFGQDDVRREVYSRILQRQSPNVDVVSGATVSSKAYMKAVESALLLK